MIPDELALGAAVLRILVAEQLVDLATASAWIAAHASDHSDLLAATDRDTLVAALREVPGAREHRFIATGPYVVRALRAAVAPGITPALAITISHQAYLLVHPVFCAAWPRLKALHALAEQALPARMRTLDPPTAAEVEALHEIVAGLLDDVIAQPDWDEDAEPEPDRYGYDEDEDDDED